MYRLRRTQDGSPYLLAVAQPTEEEAHSQDEQQIGQYGPQKRGLDDADLVLSQGLVSPDTRYYMRTRDILPLSGQCYRAPRCQ